MKVHHCIILSLLGINLSGCATIATGVYQPVTVSTSPVEGASCRLSNNVGAWYVTTPGTVTVHKSRGDLMIQCIKDGYAAGSGVAIAHHSLASLGNIVVGGPVGAGVDFVDGANHYYDRAVVVPLGAAIVPPATTAPMPATSPTS